MNTIQNKAAYMAQVRYLRSKIEDSRRTWAITRQCAATANTGAAWSFYMRLCKTHKGLMGQYVYKLHALMYQQGYTDVRPSTRRVS